MSEFGTGTMRRVAAQPDREAAARRPVAWRIERGLLDHEGALNVLLALGLEELPVVESAPVRRVAPEQHPETKQFLKRSEP